MTANQAMYPIQTMCCVLGVSRAGYYAWRDRGPSARARCDGDLAVRIRAIHTTSRETYGAPRIHAELTDQGIHVGRKRVERLMKAEGLAGVSRRQGPRSTLRDDRVRPACDLVDRFVHELFRSQTLRQESFSITGAGCRVNKTARQAFFRAYEAAAPVHRRLLGRVCRQFVAELRQQAPQAGQFALVAPSRSHRKETSDEERDMDYRL
ncbi:MAG: IS3 family transposase [Rhodospirillaceae bacterium]|nr:IS3 family transposase [Rhodospirillaceae bacterium]